MTAHRPISVNLLPKDPFFESFLGQFLLWALSIGRYIVIFTELIVILAFLSRFKLDRDLTDLNQMVLDGSSYVKSYDDLEIKYKKIQEKVNFLDYVNKQNLHPEVLKKLTAHLPPDVRLDEIGVLNGDLKIKGISLSNSGFTQFLQRLEGDSIFDNISITKISASDTDSGIEFDVSSKIKGLEKIEE